MVYRTSDNNYATAKFIVDPTPGQGSHTTIASAITSASSGDTIFIRPGTYTENLTLKSGVNLSGSVIYGGTPNTKIIGKLIDNGGSIVSTITDIGLQTNSDFIVQLTGTSSTVAFGGCYLSCTNNTGLSIAASNNLSLSECNCDVGTTGIGFYSNAGSISFYYTQLTNSGSTVTASSNSGSIIVNHSDLGIPLSTSGTGAYTFFNSGVNTSSVNATALTTAGTGVVNLYHSQFFSGSASAISVGSGTSVNMYKSIISSSNTNSVTGSGTFTSDDITYLGNHGNNVTTRGFPIVGENGSFTPLLAFGGGSTGITYAGNTGSYTRIGNVINFTLSIVLTSKGSSTGSATISGLPYSALATSIFAISASSLTYVGMVNARLPSGTSFSIDQWATAGSRTQLDDTAFTNSTIVQITGSYLA